MEGLIFGILRYMTESSLCPEGVLPIMAYTGSLHPKGVPFSGLRYMKG